MQQPVLYSNNKWLTAIALIVLFGCIALYEYTTSYYFLLAPFVFLYIVLLGINWKAAYWMLLFCIPLSVQLNFLDSNSAISLPDEPIMWLFLILGIVIIAHRPDALPGWWWRNPVVFIVVLQLLWLCVAVAYSQVFLFSVKFLIAKLWYLTCFFIFPIWLFKEKRDFKKGFLIIMIPTLITVIIIFTRQAMNHFSFRKVEKAINNLYYNHVDYSTVISMIFPLLCVALPLTRKMNVFVRIILLLIALFFIPAIILSFARAAVIAVVFAVFIALAIRLKVVNWVMPAFYGLIVLLVVYMSTNNKYIEFRPDFKHTYMHTKFADHLIATVRGQDMSSMERVYRWIAAFRMSEDRPITGYGPHAFYYFYKPYAVTAFRTYVSRNDEHSTTHNYFIFMLVEQGWPAMLLYAALVIAIFAQAQRTYHRFKDRFYKLCTMGLAMMFASCFINNFFSELIETHKVGPLFYLCISLLVILNKKSIDMQQPEVKPLPQAD